jgi:type IV pilus assembly protein PilY1
VRLHNGKWAVIVGNGLNSSEADGAQSPDNDNDGLPDSHAVLYILFIEGPGNDGVWDLGTEYVKLDTGVGTTQDPKGQNRPNGLSSVFPVDKDGDFVTDYIYAGDLFGNVWRFNMTETSSSNWYPAEYDGDNLIDGTPTPLFTALDAGGNSQPITTQIQVGKHPNGISHGVMVYFGTGKYLEAGDELPDTSTTQTFYGIWDKDFDGVGPTIDVLDALDGLKKKGYARSELQQQAINAEDSTQTLSDGSVVNLNAVYRRVTDNAITWDTATTTGVHGWYLDLLLSGGSNEGEMVITDPVLRGNAVVFTTLVPSDNPCVAGGQVS